MTSTSFDSVITINKRSADSLVDIIENDNYNTVVLDTKCVVDKVKPSEIIEIFEEKDSKDGRS